MSSEAGWIGRLYSVERAEGHLEQLDAAGESLVLDLSEDSGKLHAAAEKARKRGIEVWGFIEVARDPEAAAAHPEWMHAPQHHEWLQLFPEYRARPSAHPALVAPWICVNSQAVFDYALNRVKRLAAAAPPLDGLFLNDIQGAPAGCGCGNVLCRSWDNSPGEKVAATPYTSPEVFFTQVFWNACRQALAPLTVTPVLCGECEIGIQVAEAFSPDDTLGNCRGIDCSSVCSLHYWPAMVRSFAADKGGPEQVGMLTPYKLFGRDVPQYGETAAWVAGSLQHYRKTVPAAKLIAVLQGWDATAEEREAQHIQATEGGAMGMLWLEEPLDQSFWPVPLPEGYTPIVPPALCGHKEL